MRLPENRTGMTWTLSLLLAGCAYQKDRDIALTYHAQGLDAYEKQEYATALLFMDSSLAKYRWPVTAWAAKGRIQARLGKYDEALSTYNVPIKAIEALKFKNIHDIALPIYADIYSQRSLVKDSLGDTAGARADRLMAEKFDAERPKPSWWRRLFR
jgi:tetratricopeptide (TPR) repeat protein